jgi:micrococcal nuclease
MYEYRATIVRVVDGDTVDVDIDLGFEVTLKKQRIRLIGIDAPETRSKDQEEKALGLASKAHLESLLPIGSRQHLLSREYHGERGKYGRILGDFKMADGTLTEFMLRGGHAVPMNE